MRKKNGGSHVNAQPTKDLFIFMLTKDLPLTDAISDLVDNSVDGARKLRPSGSLRGLRINIVAKRNYFQIEDNCGGISVDVARDYAFRFGRPADIPLTPGSIGRFGIGMKRALFKLGKKFKVESTAARSHFILDVDVEEWQQKDEPEWGFEFTSHDDALKTVPVSERRTIIHVEPIFESVSERFALENFITGLIQDIELRHLYSIEHGLKISVNGHLLKSKELQVLESKQIRTAYWEYTYPNDGKDVIVKLYAGIGESDLDAGGWYVFCNGRLVMGPGQSLVTGWGEKSPIKIPKYHNQYDRFRGFAFLDSLDAGKLPWNTTKTSVDVDSPQYIAVRLEMLKLMRPVIDFLNKVHNERQRRANVPDERYLEQALDAGKLVKLTKARTAPKFVAPTPKAPQPKEEGMTVIKYSKPSAEVKQVKQMLGVKTDAEVGEGTFDYFLKMEGG